MKIVLISQNASPGLLIFRSDFIKYLVDQGHEVYAFALDYTEASKASVIGLGAIPVEYSLNKSGVNPFRDLKDTWSLSRQLKLIKPEIVFSFFVKPSIYGTLAAKLAGVPRRIAMLEGLGYIHTRLPDGFSFKKRILQCVHGLLSTVGYSAADKVLFLNEDDPRDLAKVSFLNKDKLEVIGPIGLNLSQYPQSVPDMTKPIRFIFIGRLLQEKGILEYLDAARLVKQKYPEVEFVVLGGLDKDNPSALKPAQLADLIEEDLIIYPGHVDDVPDWIRSSHVFVLPSYREGFPRSAQEAMAVGRAIITTNVPGCKDTVVDDENGYLVPAFNSNLLAEKMNILIENPDLIVSFGSKSIEMARSCFDVEKINIKLEKILMEKPV